jgi:hypothetical protein
MNCVAPCVHAYVCIYECIYIYTCARAHTHTHVNEKTCNVTTTYDLNKYGFVSFAVSSPYTICLYAIISTWHRHSV